MINTVVLGHNRSLSVDQVLRSARIWAWQRKYKPSKNEALPGLSQTFRILQALQIFAAVFQHEVNVWKLLRSDMLRCSFRI